MSSRRGILAGGNWIVDRVKLVDVFPEQDTLANILGESEANGGSPYNVLKDLRRLGADFSLEAAGLIGTDGAGRWILDDCKNHDIDTAQLRTIPDVPTSYTDVMTVQSTGRRTFFHQRGANALLGPEHFDFGATRAKWFHLGYLLLLDTLDAPGPLGTRAAEVLRAARNAGMTTSVDVVSEDSNRFADVVLKTLPEVDVLLLNEFEAGRTVGVELRKGAHLDCGAVEDVARNLLAAGVRRCVVIHFPEGAMSAEDNQVVWQPAVAMPASEIRGAVGAGDALAAGVLLALHEQRSLEEALRLGVCAAASCLRDATTSGGVLSEKECLALSTKYGWRTEIAL